MMEKKKQTMVGITLVAAVIISGIWWLISYEKTPGKYDVFARCLKDRGAIFYGAFWCPHCQKQKAMFGKSAKLLPYVECSTADGRGQLPVCQDKKIEGYPTWEFTDGSRESGEVALSKLAEKSGCELPK